MRGGRPTLSLTVSTRPLKVLDEAQLERLHRASLRILEQVGVEVYDDEALAILAQAGADVDSAAKRVRFPAGLVERALSLAPSRFPLRARNPRHNLEIGGDAIALLPVGGPSLVADLEHGRRPGTFADQVNFIKLAQSAPRLDAACRCVEAQDLPLATRHLDYLLATVRFSDKPLLACASEATSARDSLAVAALLFGGAERLRETPGVLTVVNADSPLRLGTGFTQTVIAFARERQPVMITPFILPGIASPVTPAGAVAQQNAENLAGIALAQAVSPGTPVVYGSFATNADMRTAAPVFGSARGMQMEVAAGQLAERYGLPHRGTGLVTTAHAPDEQAGWEKMNCLWALAQSNTHVILHAAGWLESGLTASYEQFVLDLEMIEGMSRFAADFAVDDTSLALDTIDEVGPGGSFLLTEHTLANFRLASYLSTVVDSRPYDAWPKDTAPSLTGRAHAAWQRQLAEYAEPSIDPALLEAVGDYVTRRRRGEPTPV